MRIGTITAAACVALGFGAPAAAAKYVLDVTARAEQPSRFEDGREVVDDATPTSSVRVMEPRQQTPKQSGFRVYVTNNSGKPFNFGPENITVRLQDGTAVAMLTYQDLMKQSRTSQEFASAQAEVQTQTVSRMVAQLTRDMNRDFTNAGTSPYLDDEARRIRIDSDNKIKEEIRKQVGIRRKVSDFVSSAKQKLNSLIRKNGSK